LQKKGGVRLKYTGDFKNDFATAGNLGTSLVDFLNSKVKNNTEIIHTEILKEKIAEMLDRYSGVDAVMFSNNDLSGVALRIQKHSDKNWGTFTIRYSRHTGTETEYSKRIRQIYDSHPSFYPHYTCQAYWGADNKMIGGAFCKTKDLFDTIRKFEPFNNGGKVYIKTNWSDNNTFLVVPFDCINPIYKF